MSIDRVHQRANIHEPLAALAQVIGAIRHMRRMSVDTCDGMT